MNLKEYKVQVALGLISYGDKCKIAVNTNAIKLLEYLSRDKDIVVKCAIAKNKNTPGKVLELLSKDKDYPVRCKVAINKNVSKKILKYLSRDEDYVVRYWVTNNKNTPVEILKILSKDKNTTVKNKAKERLDELERI